MGRLEKVCERMTGVRRTGPRKSSTLRRDGNEERGGGLEELQAAKPTRLFEWALEHIRHLIIDGHLQPGDRLPSETELSARLDVSRSSIREALRALEARGLVEVKNGAGAYVAARPFSFGAMHEAVEWLLKRRDSLLQFLEVREVLEGRAALLAARAAPQRLLAEIRAVVAEQFSLAGLQTSIDTQAELDCQFHMLVAKASGNEILEELVGAIVPVFCESNRAVLYLSAHKEDTLREHQQIVDAIASSEPAMAERVMLAHIGRVRAEVARIRERSGAAGIGK